MVDCKPKRLEVQYDAVRTSVKQQQGKLLSATLEIVVNALQTSPLNQFFFSMLSTALFFIF